MYAPVVAGSAYGVLGVSPSATTAEIRAAYRQLAKLCHPDVVGAAGEARFLEVHAAYEVLVDPARRSAYDAAPAAGDEAQAALVAELRRRRGERRRRRLERLY